MVVRLQLMDGTTREYPVAYPQGESYADRRTKCRLRDCEHLECALDCARALISHRRDMMVGVPLVTLLIIGIFIWIPFTDEQGVVFIVLALLVLNIVMVRHLNTSRDTYREQLAELQEYRDSRTVKGVSARQVFETSLHGENREGLEE